MKHTLLLMAVMALTTYLIRMLPFVVFRRKITSRFARSFLSYAPVCRPDGHDHSVRLHLDRQRSFRRRWFRRRHAAGAEEEIPDCRRRRGLYRGVFDGAGAVKQKDTKKRNPRCAGGSVFASGWEYMSAGVHTGSLWG